MGEVNICKQCGAPLDLLKNRYYGDDGYYYIKCSHCNQNWREDTPVFPPIATSFYTQGKLAFDQHHFEDAIMYFDNAISNAKGYYEAYWFRLLADNGIEYVLDPLDGKRKPTCHRCSDKPLMEQNDFISACKYAPSDVIRESYEASAKEIDKIRQSVLNQSKSGVDFDVFISFKKTETNDDREDSSKRNGEEVLTQDCILASTLYNKLAHELKLKVFYSEETLKNAVGADFEATIFRALDTAKVFILIGSKTEYINAPWVKNEWMRYYRMMAQGKKIDGSLLYVYPDKLPDNLNRELATRQALKFNNPDFYPSLTKAIRRIMYMSDQGSRMDRRKIESRIETALEVKSELVYQNRDFSRFVGQSNELLDEQRLAFIEDAIKAQNFSGAEQMLMPMLNASPDNPKLNLLKFYIEEGITGNAKCVALALKNATYISKLDSIIGLCGENDVVLKDILNMIATIFKKSCEVDAHKMASMTFKILCQCSNLSLIQNNMAKLIDQMRELSLRLFKKLEYGKSKEIFAQMLSAIGLCDTLNAGEKSAKYALYNFAYANIWHGMGRNDEAIKYYNEAIKYNPNNAQFYYCLWQAKHSIPLGKITSFTGKDFGQDEVEKVLVHSTSDKERNQYINNFVDYAVMQAECGCGYAIGNALFEYIISVVPDENISLNKDIILKYSDTLVKYGYFADARKYLNELLKLTSNNCSKAHWLMVHVDLECRTDEAVLQDDSVVDLQSLQSYINAYSSGTFDEQIKYMDFNNRKLATYEQSRVGKGFSLLEQGKFDDAKNVFEALLDFEENTRKKRKGTDYPIAYWGLMLADLKCRNDRELLQNENPVDLTGHLLYEKAIACSDVADRKKYEDLNRQKIEKYIQRCIDKGYTLLQQREFDKATETYNALLDFKKNNLKILNEGGNGPIYWGLMLADLKCRNVKDLLDDDSVIDLKKLPLYHKAVRCGNAWEYESIMSQKLSDFDHKCKDVEKSYMQQGDALLAQGKFKDAKKTFETLLDYERETHQKQNTAYPIAYWKMLLAECKCKSTEQLANTSFRRKYLDKKLAKMTNYQNYSSAYFAYRNSFDTRNEINTLAAERNQNRTQHKSSTKLGGKRFGFALLIILTIAIIAAAAYGTYLFFGLGVSDDWFQTLCDNIGVVSGVLVGIPAGIGAIIGLFTGGGYGALGGAAIGAGGGAVLLGLVFACCWVLIPIIAVGIIVGIGFGLHAIRRAIED